jgi:uncharacterized protein (DUF58 family)
VKRTARPTRRAVAIGGGALLLFGVGTNVQAGWVLVVAALLLGVLIVGLILPTRSLKGITVTRTVPVRSFSGQPVPVRLHVTNAARSMRVLLHFDDDFLGRSHVAVDTIGSGATRTYEASRTGARRGVHDSGTVVLESGAPFGVLTVKQTSRIASPIVVYPAVYSAEAWVLRGPAGWPAPSALGDVSTVRDYKSSDPLRHIHWRSTAKRGQLMVREFDREVHASTAVFADVPADLDHADAVATIASSIALSALRDGEVSVGGTRARTPDAVLDWGARLVPTAPFETSPLERHQSADAVVYVGTASLTPVDRLSSLASTSSVSAVIVDDGPSTDAVAGRLRGSGASVAVVAPEAVREWFEGGCRAS